MFFHKNNLLKHNFNRNMHTGINVALRMFVVYFFLECHSVILLKVSISCFRKEKSCLVCLFGGWGFSVALEPVLEFRLYTRPILNSQRSPCLCPPSTVIKGTTTASHVFIFMDIYKTISVWVCLVVAAQDMEE